MKNAQASEECSNAYTVIAMHTKQFLEHLHESNYSPRTLEIYGRSLRDLDRYLVSVGIERLSDVGIDELTGYRLSLVEREFMPESISTYLRGVRGMFRWLESCRLIFVNPADSLVTPASPRALQRIPTENEMSRLLAAPDISRPTGVRDRAILEVAYGSGLRRAELAELTCSGVDLVAGTVRAMGKGRRERVVPLTSMAVRFLRPYMRRSRQAICSGDFEELWLGRFGPLGVQSIALASVNASRRADIHPPIRPHAIRRACATHMLRHGASPVDIQHLLGHVSLKHLSQYLAVSITELHQFHAASNPGR
jgi:site-specific recombinase XerD